MSDSEDSDAIADIKNARGSVLPEKSRQRYVRTYHTFKEWCTSKNIININESTFLTYFTERALILKSPSSLWCEYSMLKSTMAANDNINMGVFSKLQSFLKENNYGYVPKKSKMFRKNDVETFLRDAPDDKYLMMKVAMILGIAGACRTIELYNLHFEDVEMKPNVAIVRISPKNKCPRRFVVSDSLNINWFEFIEKYIKLRPKDTKESRLFMRYGNGKCVRQVVGRHTLSDVPSNIAKFLNLKDDKSYTGNSFRRTAVSLFGNMGDLFALESRHDGWKSKLYERIITVNESVMGPSTSTSYSRNETNESTYSITDEDSTAEDMYQDDGDGDGDIEGDVEGDGEGEVDEKKTDLLDISDTRILQDAVEPLRVEVDRELPSPGECELFGEYIARHLQNLPISVALKLQSGIHNLVMQTRLEYIRDHPSEAPAMVKQEPLLEENEEEDSRPPNTETPTNQPVSDKPVQIRPEKRPPNTDPPEPKRFKPDSSRSETQKSSASTTHGQQKKRTDCAVFAEHIALQLEQLPEEISLQLQSDIYALITQACPKPADEGAPPHRVKIKAETVDAMPIELINEYYDNV